MEVILLEPVQNLGEVGDLVKVKPGYARNYLLPQGLAYEATPGNKKRIEGEARARHQRLSAEKGEAEALAARLGQVTVTLTAKAGEGERLFGSITAQDVAGGLEAQGFAIDRRKIELEQPLKQLGFHTVPIRLHPEVHAEVRVSIVTEPE